MTDQPPHIRGQSILHWTIPRRFSKDEDEYVQKPTVRKGTELVAEERDKF